MPGDPHWDDVIVLMGFDDGTDGDKTTTDEGPLSQSLTFGGTGEVDDSRSKFGANSWLVGSNTGQIVVPNQSGVSVANNNDKTYEMFFILDSLGKTHALYDKRDTGGAEEFSLAVTAANVLQFQTFISGNGDVLITGTDVVTTGVQYHVAACRDNGEDWQIFLAGISQGTDTETGQPSSNSGGLQLGKNRFDNSRFLDGGYDECRVTEFCRYTANFTPPTQKFPRGPFVAGREYYDRFLMAG